MHIVVERKVSAPDVHPPSNAVCPPAGNEPEAESEPVYNADGVPGAATPFATRGHRSLSDIYLAHQVRFPRTYPPLPASHKLHHWVEAP